MITIPKKTVVAITENELPEPFNQYWNHSKPGEKLERPGWKFYLVDGELYILNDGDSRIMQHWSQSNCCGVAWFIHENKLKFEDFPLVATNGEYLFQLHGGFYQMLARFEDGSTEIVYDG